MKSRDFLSFKGESRLSFAASGLWRVSGTDPETGVRSGVGKSNVFAGIAHGLMFGDKSANKLTTWKTDQGYELDLDLELDGKVLSTMQGEGVRTQVLFDSEVVAKGKEARAALEQKLGISLDLLGNLTYFRQRKEGYFLNMTDSKKKEFLSEVLRLDFYEKEVKAAQGRVRELERKHDAQKAVVENVQGRLRKAEQDPNYVRGAPSRADLDLARLSLTELEGRLKTAEQELASQRLVLSTTRETATARIRASATYQELVAERARVVDESNSTVEPETVLKYRRMIAAGQAMIEAEELELGNEIRKYEEKMKDSRSAEYVADLIEGKRMEIEDFVSQQARDTALTQVQLEEKVEAEELLAIPFDEYCDKCGRGVQYAMNSQKLYQNRKADAETKMKKLEEHQEYLKLALEEARAELKLLEEEQKQGYLAKPTSLKLEQMLKAMNKARDLLAAALADWQAGKHHETSVALDDIDRQKADLEKNYVFQQVSAKEADVSRSVILVTALSSEVVRKRPEVERLNTDYQLRLERWQKASQTVEQLAKELHDLEVDVQVILDDLNVEQEVVKAVGREGFMGSIFDETLDQIAQRTNDKLASVPNVSKMTLEFRSENLTTKDEVKKEIRTILFVDGYETTPKDGASGGQAGVLEVATDLSVAEIVFERLGVEPGWVIFDETLKGLGPVEMTACLQLLKQVAEEKLVLLVEHDTLAQEYCTNVIDIGLRGGVSSFSQDGPHTTE